MIRDCSVCFSDFIGLQSNWNMLASSSDKHYTESADTMLLLEGERRFVLNVSFLSFLQHPLQTIVTCGTYNVVTNSHYIPSINVMFCMNDAVLTRINSYLCTLCMSVQWSHEWNNWHLMQWSAIIFRRAKQTIWNDQHQWPANQRFI